MRKLLPFIIVVIKNLLMEPNKGRDLTLKYCENVETNRGIIKQIPVCALLDEKLRF